MFRFLLLLNYFFVILFSTYSQDLQYNFILKKASDKIKIDGLNTEKSWEEAAILDNFQISKPQDTAASRARTEVRLTFDDKFLYVYADCFDSLTAKKYIVQSLKRDFSFPRTDAFVIHVDPFLDGSNGFSFGCNPFGAQREGVLEAGGKFGVSTAWDNKWYSETTRQNDKWTVEMAIPFKTLRYNHKLDTWKINFSRNDQKLNETSTWVPVPLVFNVANMAFMGKMQWAEAPGKAGSNISLIPYVLSRYGENYEKTPTEKTFNPGLGGDAKIGVSTSLNLDLTFNPDFSNVEVDDQQLDVNRFELVFPEKRQFFIENNDIFGSLGFDATRPFFSRRIGLVYDPTKKVYVENRILAGARLSGKIGTNWRLGAMTLQTEKDPDIHVLSNNYSVLALQRKMFSRSNFSLFSINKQGFGTDSTADFSRNKTQQNSVLGAEYVLQSKDSKWDGKVYYHQEFVPNQSSFEHQSYGSDLTYNVKKLKVQWHHEYVGKNFKPEVGFVPRQDFQRIDPALEYYMYRKKGIINFHGPKLSPEYYLNTNGKEVEHIYQGSYYIRFNNTAEIEGFFVNQYVLLQRDFDPSGKNGLKLLNGSDYNFNYGRLNFKTDERKDWFLTVNTYFGEYYLGKRYRFDTEIRYRASPWGVFSLRSQYSIVEQPMPYTSSNLLIIGPKVEILFSTKMFWTTYFQYNEQRKNININSKIQWRFKPASDMFFVFTDNYFSDEYVEKNWAIVFKISYWFNL